MDTPILDFLSKYDSRGTLRFHMPGHKGKSVIGPEPLDITEINGADVLYLSDGIIKESEENATRLFGSKKTLYSTEGSSLSIRAMIYLLSLYAKERGETPLILAGRNAHKSFMHAVATVDCEVEWIYPESDSSILTVYISEEKLERRFESQKKKPTALYITSPDYLGNVADIESISRVCKKHGVLLLVDNAHGAYLAFTEKKNHPILLGADMCCDSAHKTLPALTGGAYLHISKSAPVIFTEMAECAMSIFASTSPSYLILASLDALNKRIDDGYRGKISELAKNARELKQKFTNFGYKVIGNEDLKITLATKELGYKGTEIAEILEAQNMICEFADEDYIVFMLSSETSKKELTLLSNALLSIEKKEKITRHAPPLTPPKRALSIREALFSVSCEVSVSCAIGKTLASASIACPPAIPILVCGEIIDENSAELFKYYKIEKCRIVKE